MKICLAGTGAMAAVHAKALKKIDGVEIVSVTSREADSGKTFAAEYGVPHTSTDLAECVDRPGVDAVILTPPSRMHADQTVLALSKGKHVQVEIPMSLNLADAQRIADAARSSGRVRMVPTPRPFSSPPREIPRRIQDGTFHLHHMIVETYFFRRENTNMLGQPRSWVDNLLRHHGCHSVDLHYCVLDAVGFVGWGQKGSVHPVLGIAMALTVDMKSPKGPLFTMAMSFNNKGP